MRGQSSINLIVVIILSAMVAVAGLYLVFKGKAQSGESITLSDAKSSCEAACAKDNQLLISGEIYEDGSCGQGLAPNFCSGSFKIAGRTLRCYDITKCVLTFENGRTCVVTSNSC